VYQKYNLPDLRYLQLYYIGDDFAFAAKAAMAKWGTGYIRADVRSAFIVYFPSDLWFVVGCRASLWNHVWTRSYIWACLQLAADAGSQFRLLL
jgi:hypothetical protein